MEHVTWWKRLSPEVTLAMPSRHAVAVAVNHFSRGRLGVITGSRGRSPKFHPPGLMYVRAPSTPRAPDQADPDALGHASRPESRPVRWISAEAQPSIKGQHDYARNQGTQPAPA
jgi:hypothetical protein